MRNIEELKKEIDRLQNIALEQFEEKRIPNDKNHKRLMKLKKQLERLQKEGEHWCCTNSVVPLVIILQK